ncbi:MAG: hypothetical protein ABGW77_02345 [Campylobacterales bacterium]
MFQNLIGTFKLVHIGIIAVGVALSLGGCGYKGELVWEQNRSLPTPAEVKFFEVNSSIKI